MSKQMPVIVSIPWIHANPGVHVVTKSAWSKGTNLKLTITLDNVLEETFLIQLERANIHYQIHAHIWICIDLD